LRAKAFEMASKWIMANYKLYKCCDQMFEKIGTDGKVGGGGEYVVQAGFGWTNGAILDLLVRYKDTIKYNGNVDDIPKPKDCNCEPKGANPNNPTDPNKNNPTDPNNPTNPKKSQEPKKQEEEV
jgi:hypothetical protein